MPTDIETMNDQMVGLRDGRVQVLLPRQVMTPEQALRHAAWLVVVAEALDPEHTFDEVLAAVRET